jgi:hypothetical protein
MYAAMCIDSTRERWSTPRPSTPGRELADSDEVRHGGIPVPDPVIVRTARVEPFNRPTDHERGELFAMDLDGLSIKDDTMRELVRLTGPRDGGPGFTFSLTCAHGLLPLMRSAGRFPIRPLTSDDLLQAAKKCSRLRQ